MGSYLKLIRESRDDPSAVFEKGVADGDALSVAFAAALAPETDSDLAVARVKVLAQDAPPGAVGDLLTFLLNPDEEEALPDGLPEFAETHLQERRTNSNSILLNEEQVATVAGLALDDRLTGARRALLLWWVNEENSAEGRRVAEIIVSNVEEKYSNHVQRSCLILGPYNDADARSVIGGYIRRNFQEDTSGAAQSKQGLYALNCLKNLGESEIEWLAALMGSAASVDVAPGGRCGA